jgi:hypothetical protein
MVSPILWRNTQTSVPFWRDTLGASGYETRALRHGIYDPPIHTSKKMTQFRLPEIPVDKSHTTWLQQELTDCIRRKIYEPVSTKEAQHLHSQGYPISNAFIVETTKNRLVINLKRQSKLFREWPVKMETIESFGLQLLEGDHLLSFDIEKGYHHFRLHPSMRNWFLFVINGKHYRCIALPFGWRLSPAWFIKLMRPFVRHIRDQLHYRCLPYMDDFCVAPTDGSRPATQQDALLARQLLGKLLARCGLRRKEGKGCWTGSQQLDHLGFHIDTARLVFGIPEIRLLKLRDLAKHLMDEARRNRRLVDTQSLRRFCGSAISTSLAMPLARFYTRSLYDSLKSAKKRSRLTHQGIKDLQHWKNLLKDPSHRLMQTPRPTMAMHSDASTEVGQGGTLGSNLQAGSQGQWEARGLWDPIYRTKHITHLELKAVTDNLHAFTKQLQNQEVRNLLLWEDNQAVVHILNSMVSKSPALMTELRTLHKFITTLGITIQARYLPSAVNRFADRLSRLKTLDDWRINPTPLQSLLQQFKPGIDRFADQTSSICARFNSLHLCPGTEAVNALSQPWGQDRNFWNPPIRLLPLVVEKISQEAATGILITPCWPAQSWYARLKSLSHQATTYEAADLYLPPAWAPHGIKPPPWKMTVWEL